MSDPSGCKVLITRAREQAQEFGSFLSTLGLEAIFFPTIEILEPESWDECDRRINGLDGYTDLIFTSANGVRFFLKRVERARDLRTLMDKTFHAVGTKTKRAIEDYGFTVLTLPDQFNARQLAEAIRSRHDASGHRFLFPHGDLSDDTLVQALRECAIEVDPVVVYRTVRPVRDEPLVQTIREQLRRGEISVVTFFSPSSVKHFVEMFPEFPAAHTSTIAVIGETTAKACRELGVAVDLVPTRDPTETPAETLANLIHDKVNLARVNEKD